MRLEENNCTCNASCAESLFSVEDLNFGSADKSALMLLCQGCGSKRPSHFPVEGDVHLGYKNYYTLDKRRSTVRSLISNFFAWWNRAYNYRYVDFHYAQLLDYGCGSGDYISRMTRRNPFANHLGTDVLKSDLFPSDLACWTKNDQLEKHAPFDVITLGHVIEHLKFPKDELSRCCSLLSEKGNIVITTPNAQSPILFFFRQYARDYDFPRHRIIFSRSELYRLLQDNGMRIKANPSPPLVNTAANLWSSLQCVRRKNGAGMLYAIYTLSAAVALISVSIIKILRLRKYEPELVVVAEKCARSGEL